MPDPVSYAIAYRLFFVSPEMGYFVRSEAFDALNDTVAIAIAERQSNGEAAELWCGGRLVARFPAGVQADQAERETEAA